jgi:predicted amidohydrolase YtcJ
VEWVRTAHEASPNVTVHCVTRGSVALMVSVWREAGALRGDRVEHGAVVDPELAVQVAELQSQS